MPVAGLFLVECVRASPGLLPRRLGSPTRKSDFILVQQGDVAGHDGCSCFNPASLARFIVSRGRFLGCGTVSHIYTKGRSSMQIKHLTQQLLRLF